MTAGRDVSLDRRGPRVRHILKYYQAEESGDPTLIYGGNPEGSENGLFGAYNSFQLDCPRPPLGTRAN